MRVEKRTRYRGSAPLQGSMHPGFISLAAHLLLTVGIAVRVIMQRPSTGVALAWLVLVAMVPFAGAAIYLMIGDRRLSPRRTQRMQAVQTNYRHIWDMAIKEGVTDIDWSRHSAAARGMDRLGRNSAGSPTVRGSSLELVSDPQTTFRRMAEDVDRATTSLLMEFYIWNAGGAADDVLEAVIRAAGRGVSCRILIDALGARTWWKGPQPKRLREAGVKLLPALPVSLFRSLVGRADLRLHRKIVVVDSDVAWTGSMNLADPRYFQQDEGVGQWVDAMVRVEGTVVAPLAITVISDWMVESGEPMGEIVQSAGFHLIEPRGVADVQIVPTGPGVSGDGLLQMLLAIINAAREELVLTTPYLIPDVSILEALRGAAGRGVEVSIILPAKVNYVSIRYASRSYYDDLMDNGVSFYLYRDGLLHTKSIMVDGEISMFGSVNLDMRSLWLNYEVALFVYDPAFAQELKRLQQSYLAHSDKLDPASWETRPFASRFLENTLRLASPLL